MANSNKEVTQVLSHRTSSRNKAHTQPISTLKANIMLLHTASLELPATDLRTPMLRLRATEA